MSFGQHQTFYLRQQWINKGLKEVKDNPRFFYESDHFEVLGVGKNMAKSIRHWLNVMQLVKEVRSTQVEIQMTELAHTILKYDPYINSKKTLTILHYLLVTEKNEATTWYWFYNVFNERVFNKTMLMEQLSKWVEVELEKSVSPTTLKKDIDCLIQLYTLKEYKNKTPEDVIKSPFEILGLIQETTGANYIKTAIDLKQCSDVLYITFLKYLEKYELKEVSLNDLLNGEELWGKVFNLNRDTILYYIDDIQERYPIKFTRTNRLDVIRLEKDVNWLEEIRAMYENEVLL